MLFPALLKLARTGQVNSTDQSHADVTSTEVGENNIHFFGQRGVAPTNPIDPLLGQDIDRVIADNPKIEYVVVQEPAPRMKQPPPRFLFSTHQSARRAGPNCPVSEFNGHGDLAKWDGRGRGDQGGDFTCRKTSADTLLRTTSCGFHQGRLPLPVGLDRDAP